MLVPKLRFKREDGTDYPEWENCVLDSIGSFYGGLSGKTKEDFGKGNSKFVTYMNVYKNIFAMQEMLESVDISDNEKQNKVKYGDLLMTQSSETVEELGMSSVYLFYDEPYLNSFCFGLHLYNHALTYPMYIGYLMRSETIRKQIMREGQGISRINLSPNRMKGMILPIPCLEEQQKIADFLSNVDEVIAQSEEEVANLQHQKKAAMQKIFSQEVRFNREDRTSYPEWEEKKLGAIGKAIIGSGFSKKYQGHKDLPIPFYKVSDMNNVGNEIVMNNSNNYVSEELLLKMGLKACQQNAIIFAKVGAALMLDRKRIANKPFLVDNNMMIFMPNENNELRYIYHWLTNIRLSKYAQIGALPSFNASDIEYVVIPLPCLEEQQKIADFLATYDEAISCAKQELDKWKELKKGLLQQMFA